MNTPYTPHQCDCVMTQTDRARTVMSTNCDGVLVEVCKWCGKAWQLGKGAAYVDKDVGWRMYSPDERVSSVWSVYNAKHEQELDNA